VSPFVLVHGGGHGGWCWDAVACRLRQAGNVVHAPTLSGLAERQDRLSPDLTLDTHVEDIASLTVAADLWEVILVGHSYGGMVITGVADRLAGRVGRLVFLDAAIPADGECLMDVSPGLLALADTRELEGVKLGLWPEERVVRGIYGLDDPGLVSHAMQHLTPHPWRTFETRLHFRDPAGLAAIPRAIINCANTLARRDPHLLPRWSAGDFVRTVDGAHDLMLTDPDLVERLLLDIAAL